MNYTFLWLCYCLSCKTDVSSKWKIKLQPPLSLLSLSLLTTVCRHHRHPLLLCDLSKGNVCLLMDSTKEERAKREGKKEHVGASTMRERERARARCESSQVVQITQFWCKLCNCSAYIQRSGPHSYFTLISQTWYYYEMWILPVFLLHLFTS